MKGRLILLSLSFFIETKRPSNSSHAVFLDVYGQYFLLVENSWKYSTATDTYGIKLEIIGGCKRGRVLKVKASWTIYVKL